MFQNRQNFSLPETRQRFEACLSDRNTPVLQQMWSSYGLAFPVRQVRTEGRIYRQYVKNIGKSEKLFVQSEKALLPNDHKVLIVLMITLVTNTLVTIQKWRTIQNVSVGIL